MQSVKLEEAEEHVCLNCGTTFRGDYCPACKQNANTKRLDMRLTVKNVIGKYITLDSGLLHTIIDLLYRPGYMVRDYMRGYRIEYIEPLMLLIILLAVDFIFPTPFPEPAVDNSVPEEVYEQLSPYPVSLAISKAMHWIWEDEQRVLVFFSFLFGLGLTLTLKLVRAGKEHILNVSESVHLFLYWVCNFVIWDLLIESLFWLLPKAWCSQAALYIICLSISITVFLVMVRDCTQLRWKKMTLFALIYPFLALFCLIAFIVVLLTIIIIELPWQMIHDTDILKNVL